MIKAQKMLQKQNFFFEELILDRKASHTDAFIINNQKFV